MTKQEITRRLHETILTVRQELKVGELKDDASFTEDLGFDSMGLVTLASELEKQFDRSLPLPDWLSQQKDKGLSLGSLIQFLCVCLK